VKITWIVLLSAGLLWAVGCPTDDDDAADDDGGDDDGGDDDGGDDDGGDDDGGDDDGGDDDGGDDDGGDDDGGDDDSGPTIICAPLPASPGPATVIASGDAAALVSAVNNASAGDTILLEDGTYELNGDYLWITAEGLSLRSQSGDRDAVILDGNYQTTQIVTITVPDVTVADLTIREAYTHPIHVNTSSQDITGTLIYNVAVIDPREQAIKINHDHSGHYPDDGEIACCHIELTDAGRPHVDGCYTGGVDAHGARNWHIHDNTIVGFWCDNGLSEHGIHLWTGSRDTLVERNNIHDCARGIGFGLDQNNDPRTYNDNPCGGETNVAHYYGVIRNNMVSADRAELFASQSGFDGGIALARSCETQILHNTVMSTQAPFASMEWRFSSTTATVTNNLVSHNYMPRNGATAVEAGNLDSQSLSMIVDVAVGNLHLDPGAAAAIDQGAAVPTGDCDEDYDGELRDDGSPDIGADEI